MTDFIDQINAMQPLRYAAQMPWGHTSLSEDQAAILSDYHADPHPAKLAILGDHVQENAANDHDYLIGQLLSRATDAMRVSPFESDENYGDTAVAQPVYTSHRHDKTKKFLHAAEVVLFRDGHNPLSVVVPASREELLRLNANARHHDHLYLNAEHADRNRQWIETAPDADFYANWLHEQRQREEPTKMQRDDAPIQFAAKTKQRLLAHPLLRGTRLELALRSIASDKSLDQAAVLAKAALLKPLDGRVFHALKDELLDQGHHLAEKYDWEQVQEKLLLDDHLLRGLRPIVNSIWNQHEILDGQSFRSRRQVAFHALHDARTKPGERAARFGDSTGNYSPRGLPTIRQQLLDHAHRIYPTLEEPQFDESLARLHAKVSRSMRDADSTPESRKWWRSTDREKALRDRDENAEEMTKMHDRESVFDDEDVKKAIDQEKAQHYAKGTPSVGGIKNAMRLLRSDNQQRNREVAATVMQRLGLSRVKLRDAVTSTRSPVAGVIAAIYHTTENGEEAVNKAAAWIGHLGGLPAVSAFHIDPSGDDSLYQMQIPLDPVNAASYLESHGISRAILSPQNDSTSVLIHDPGNKQRDRVEKAALGANVNEVRHSVGRTVSFGGDAQNPRADANARKSYRDVINS